MQTNQEERIFLTHAKRIVVKVGTRILVNKNGQPNRSRIAAIASQLIELRRKNYEIVLVTSGAIGAGMQKLGIKKRPTAIQDLQMAASVGQTVLMNLYNEFFTKAKCKIGQVLLTHADLKNRERHLNARNTILNLLKHKVLPIINENDVVSFDEIKIGDNDVLSALVTTLIDADLLILLTTPNGLRKPGKKGKTARVAYLPQIDRSVLLLVTGEKSELSTGGMDSKLRAAQTAALTGSMVVIASGGDKNVITKIIQGIDIGTLIGNHHASSILRHRKRWIAFFHKPQGELIIDKGAAEAISKKGTSLLPIGIREVIGKFSAGAVVKIIDLNNDIIACGLVEYSSKELKQIMGKPSNLIAATIGYKNSDTVVHRDNLVLRNSNLI